MRASAVLLVLVLMVTMSRPAQADSGLVLSLDGRHWSGSIDQELFDSSHVWVPGDEATVTFWVRNDSSGLADLRIEVFDVRGTLRLGRDVLLSARVDGRTSGIGERLVTESGVDGRPRRIDLTARMPASTGNEAQLRFVELRLRVTMMGQATPTSVRQEPVGPDGLLSGTGGPAGAIWVALCGLLLIGAGAAVTARRRRQP